MASQLNLDAVCACSENVVARTIEGEVVIIPLVAGIGGEEDELYTLNETGQAIWQQLDGQRTLREVAALLAKTFEGSQGELEADVLGFASELTRRGILVAKL
ncbi:MAG TPA: PqqD family protein [Smithellaceae bacterium]|nr:PqqD family protein [Smithellaceae bacterium]